MDLLVWQHGLYSAAAIIAQGRLLEYYQRSAQELSRAQYADIFWAKITWLNQKNVPQFADLGGCQQGLVQINNLSNSTENWHILQVERCATGTGKQAKLTNKIKLPGIFVIYTPNQTGLVFSSKTLLSLEEQQKITHQFKKQADHISGGFIVRHHLRPEFIDFALAEGNFLAQKWAIIKNRSHSLKTPQRLWGGEHPFWRLLRDEATRIDNIFVASPLKAALIRDYLGQYYPALVNKIQEKPVHDWVMDQTEIDSQLDDLENQRIELVSGGFLLIEEGQTLTAVDVNTGSNFITYNQRKKSSAFYMNQQALLETFRQLRLRNISGHILVDIIPMRASNERQELLKIAQEQAVLDPSYCQVAGYSRLGLLELSRQGRGLSWLKIKQLPPNE
ncbi:MAG TPA: ribonuclease E/G [Alphaproteobacteria bacterium]|jgi:ribonuclease G|nr:ribonuclease E/G [Alphaproteobacteria bacterium]